MVPALSRLSAITFALATPGFAQFSNPMIFEQPSFNTLNTFATGDVNGDGTPDVVGISTTGPVVLIGNGDATFAPAIALTGIDTLGSALRLEDLNGDGMLDIVLGGYRPTSLGAPTVAWLTGFGNGQFAQPIVLGTGATGIEGLVVLDWDGDGDEDIASFIGAALLQLEFYENLGGATFAPAVVVDTPTTFQTFRLRSADLDGDGFEDLYSYDLNGVLAYFGSSSGPGISTRLVSATTTGAATAADVDGDGTLDLAYATNVGNQFGWARGLGNRTYGPINVIRDQLLSSNGANVGASDIDGDGDTDLVAVLATDPTNPLRFRWFENLGGTFADERRLQGELRPILQMTDLDADGDVDLLTSGNDPVLWLYGEPPIQKYCPGELNAGGQPGELEMVGLTLRLANFMTMTATQLPNNVFGFFITSTTQDLIIMPGGSRGNLCLGGSIGRYVGPGQIGFSGSTGSFSLPVNTFAMPQPNGPVFAMPGETWNFQAWYRDSFQGQATSNFTSATSVLWY